MPTLQIDGIGNVQVDDSFLKLSPEMQHATVQEIAGTHKANSGPKVSTMQAAAGGAAQGAGLGFADEIGGAAAAGRKVMGSFGDAISGVPVLDAALPIVGGAKALYEKATGQEGEALTAYRQNRDAVRAHLDAAQSQHPVAFGAGEVAGGLLPMAAMPSGMMYRSGAGLGENIVRGGVTNAVLGGVQGAGEAKQIEDVPLSAGAGAVVGGIVGSALPPVVAGAGNAVSRIISPLRTSAARQPLIDTLEHEGVQLTAGQRTGHKPLQWMESAFGDLPFAGGRPAELMDRQGRQFTHAALSRAGQDAELATPDVMLAARDRIGNQFEQLSARNTLRFDQGLGNDLGATIRDYDRVLPSQQREIFHNYIDDIVSHQGAMSGEAYQVARSRLSRQANNLKNGDPDLSDALRGIRNALDGAMGRSISPQDGAAWNEARRQYGNLKTLERATSGAGERAAEGYISPAALRTAAAVRDRGAYVRGQGDFADLARAGAGALHQLPQSGTTPRAQLNQLATLLTTGAAGGAAGGYADGKEGAFGGAIAGAAGPSALGRLLMSGPAQAYLANQVGAAPAVQATGRELLALLLAGPARDQAVSFAGR